MKSFFTKQETQSLTTATAKNLTCFNCGLYKGIKSPKMEPYGKFKKKVMIIGGMPGKEEDRNGKPWQGTAGRFLERTLEKIGVDLFEDCISLNAVNCTTPKGRKPTPKEINCCRDIKVLKAIAKYKPERIVLLGKDALTGFLGHRTNKLGEITKWRGWIIPDQDYKAWICPTFHPSYVVQMDSREVSVIWEQDLRRAFTHDKMFLFPEYKPPKINYIKIEDLPNMDYGEAAFDYETPSLKPHAKGLKIICGSVTYDGDEVYAFMMPKKKSKWEAFINFLRNGKIKKIASNFKFEDHWSNIRLKTQVRGWDHDTMLTAHNLDNRSGISGLKFQAYVQLGIIGYDDEVSPYLKPTEEMKKKYGGNAINRINELLAKPGGEKLLMKYCALDSVYEFRIAQIQKAEISNRMLPF